MTMVIILTTTIIITTMIVVVIIIIIVIIGDRERLASCKSNVLFGIKQNLLSYSCVTGSSYLRDALVIVEAWASLQFYSNLVPGLPVQLTRMVAVGGRNLEVIGHALQFSQACDGTVDSAWHL